MSIEEKYATLIYYIFGYNVYGHTKKLSLNTYLYLIFKNIEFFVSTF